MIKKSINIIDSLMLGHLKLSTRIFMTIIIVIMITVVLDSCSNNKGVSDRTLITDLESYEESPVFSCYNMTVDDIEVIKRQTLPEQQKDSVWVKVSCSNDKAKGIMYFLMKYTLYNDGFLINDISEYNRSKWKFTPVKGLSNEEVESLLHDYNMRNIENSPSWFGDYDTWEIEIISNEFETIDYLEYYSDSSVFVEYKQTKSFDSCDVTQIKTGELCFNNTISDWDIGGEWFVVDTEIEESTTHSWDIEGLWKDEANEWSLTISKAEGNSYSFDVEYTGDGVISRIVEMIGKYSTELILKDPEAKDPYAFVSFKTKRTSINYGDYTDDYPSIQLRLYANGEVEIAYGDDDSTHWTKWDDLQRESDAESKSEKSNETSQTATDSILYDAENENGVISELDHINKNESNLSQTDPTNIIVVFIVIILLGLLVVLSYKHSVKTQIDNVCENNDLKTERNNEYTDLDVSNIESNVNDFDLDIKE